MAKKGKGKGPKMTEEERLLAAEQKALAEADAKRRQEEMLVNYLRDKLEKEEKYAKINNKKLISKWRTIMRAAKSTELKKEIEILSQTFERIMDRKDSVIQAMAKDLEEAEEQHKILSRAHQSNLNSLIKLNNGSVDDLENRFMGNLEEERQKFKTDTHNADNIEKKNNANFDTIICAMEQTHIEMTGEIRQEFQSIRDELKNRCLEEKHALRIQLEAAVENLWKQFQAAQKHYNESTDERRKEFEKLQQKDQKSSAEIEEQMKKLALIQENINTLRHKMNSNSKEYDEKHIGLKENKDTVLNHFRRLKEEMNKKRDRDRQTLTRLTLTSNSALKTCRNVEAKAAGILKVGEMCRKLETEEEKVLPFGCLPPTPRTPQEDDQLKNDPNCKFANVVNDYEQLDGFWRRFNKVQLDKLALEAEKRSLENENFTLRNVLRQYLDGVSVNNETLKEPNPLFVVNQRTNVKLSVPVIDPRVKRPTATVVEAAHIVNNLLEKP